MARTKQSGDDCGQSTCQRNWKGNLCVHNSFESSPRRSLGQITERTGKGNPSNWHSSWSCTSNCIHFVSIEFQDLLKFIQKTSGGRPLVISGDFNAEPTEPVYSTIINCEALGLSSAYADLLASLAESEDKSDANDSDSVDGKSGEENGEGKSRAEFLMNNEPPYTTWKIREDGEVCHTIDYVFYTQDKLKVMEMKLT